MEGIANLVTKSLVALDQDTASRWFMLETIRAYALEKRRGAGRAWPDLFFAPSLAHQGRNSAASRAMTAAEEVIPQKALDIAHGRRRRCSGSCVLPSIWLLRLPRGAQATR